MLGEILKGRLAYCASNLRPICEKTGRILMDANVKPQPVPARIILPLLESAAIEDDDSMQELWAQLLASAAADSEAVHPGFCETLKLLNPDEANAITHIYDNAPKPHPPAQDVLFQLNVTPEWYEWSETLVRLGLIEDTSPGRSDAHVNQLMIFRFTRYGLKFMRACTGRNYGTLQTPER
jgi:hypothetical protein